MEFVIKNLNKSVNHIMRQIGYVPAYFQGDGEFSIVKKITGGEYPRFHLYIVQNGADAHFRLHLDQKKPSYEGAAGHSGEYDGEVVEEEAKRIRSTLSS